MLQRGVAAEDLEQEPVEGGDGRQDAVAPNVPGGVANPCHHRAIEVLAGVLPKLPQRGINPSMHPRASCPMGRVTTP